MDDLNGSAAERIAQVNLLRATQELTADWLLRQLLGALEELAQAQPIADAERDLHEDY